MNTITKDKPVAGFRGAVHHLAADHGAPLLTGNRDGTRWASFKLDQDGNAVLLARHAVDERAIGQRLLAQVDDLMAYAGHASLRPHSLVVAVGSSAAPLEQRRDLQAVTAHLTTPGVTSLVITDVARIARRADTTMQVLETLRALNTTLHLTGLGGEVDAFHAGLLALLAQRDREELRLRRRPARK